MKYSPKVLGFLVESHYFIPFEHSSYSFIFDVSQTALLSERPFLEFVDISYRVFLVPPSERDDEVILSCCGYLTRNAGAVAIISNFEKDGMGEMFSS